MNHLYFICKRDLLPYKPPQFKSTEFNCPLCNVYSEQRWRDSTCVLNGSGLIVNYDRTLENVWFAICSHCKKYTVWIDGKMIHPQVDGSPPPHHDMPSDVKENYVEARRIVSLSPRSAAALLRISVEELVYDILGIEKGKDLNESIGILVKKGLPIRMQQSLDYLRVTGNSAVHPLGLIDTDDYNTTISLFELINLVVDVMITSRTKVKSYYDSLPQNIRDKIDERNGTKQ
jgi:Domain of unknown function (DUF4145)